MAAAQVAVPVSARSRPHSQSPADRVIRLTGAAQEFTTIEDRLSAGHIEAAAATIRGVAHRTPLLRMEAPTTGGRRRWRLKCENLQRGGSFKFRGAYNFLASLPGQRRARGVVTYSSGNHGRAVALAARELDTRAVVVVPTDAPRIKVDAISGLGAELVAAGTTSVERRTRAEQIADERGWVIVPPFDDRSIVAGQGTVGLEIVEDFPEVERVIVPIGGGGLASGVATAIRARAPDARVYGVEPEGAASMKRSLEAGKPITLESVETVADGLKPVRPGDLTFDCVRRLVEDVVLVSDAAIVDAVVWSAGECRVVLEASGAAALAAVLTGAVPDPGAPTAIVASGGNIELSVLGRWLSRRGAMAAGVA